jgi:hypothetical protein
MPDPSTPDRHAEAAAWCGDRKRELSAEILDFPGPIANIAFPKYGAICCRARDYAINLGATSLASVLGATTSDGDASIADALQQVGRLEDWLASAGREHQKGGGQRPGKRRTGRPKKTEKDSETLVVAALSKWHGYEGGSVTNYEPATNRGLADKFHLSPNALSRFLKKKFSKEKDPHRRYVTACHNETIGALLTLWNREMPGRHADLLPPESGRDNDD